MKTDPIDVPDLLSFTQEHEPAALETASHALGAMIVTTIMDDRWARTGEHGDTDPYDLAPTTVVGWRHVATGRTLGVETAPGRPILTVTLNPEGGLEGEGCTVRLPRRADAPEPPEPTAALREAYTILRLIAARALIQDAETALEPDLWGRGVAALVAAATGRDVASVTLPTPLSAPRHVVLPALHPGAAPLPRLVVMDHDMTDVDDALVDAIAAVAPTAYMIHASTRHTAGPEVQVHTHQFDRVAGMDTRDPMGEMRAIAHVRAALDAGRPS